MKKEYLILITLILILGAYLFFHKENKNNYTLPEIEKIDVSRITGIVIEKKKNVIKITKKEKNWVVTDNGYPADVPSVENILDTLKKLRLSALVSQKEDLKRYQLDDENRIQVKILENEKNILNFTLGKTAPSLNHTFVMLETDNTVYHAKGSFRSHFDKTVENFRDKKVLEFKEASIKQITIEKDGFAKTLISKEEKKETQAATIAWRSMEGISADKEMVSTLLTAISFLKCEKYLGTSRKNDLEKQEPLCKIHLKNDKDMELTLFKTDKEDTISGISSMNRDAFVLSQFSGKEIISSIEKLLDMEETASEPALPEKKE